MINTRKGRQKYHYELWVENRRILTIKTWTSQLQTLTDLRKLIEERYPGKRFEVYKIFQSKFPKEQVQEKPKPLPKVVSMRPPSEYSNKSPFKIAK